MKSEDILRSDMLDLVFDGRNKAYGAYDLRRRYPKHVGRALLITVLMVLAILLFGVIRKNLLNQEEKVETNVEVTLTEPPPMDESKPPPPPPPAPPPPPVRATIQYVPPKIVIDKEASKTDIEDIEKVKEENLGTKTQEGVKNVEDDINTNVDPSSILGNESKKVIEEKKDDDNKVFVAVEQMPEFPGGTAEMMRWLSDNIRYPSEAAQNNLTGKVNVKFVVEKDGSITDVTLIRDGVGGGAGAEALRVVKKMPKWKPGKQNGKAVRCSFQIPINFRLED